jgi:dipeptidyl aminopeptidase/acylaminoacyl peptidase
MSQPLLHLAGTRIHPASFTRQKWYFLTTFTIVDLKTGKKSSVDTPEGSIFDFPQWSNDGKWILLPRLTKEGIEPWILMANSGNLKKLTEIKLNSTLSSGFVILPDNENILLFAIPKDKGTPPKQSPVPIGPNIQETSGKVSKVRTYQDLLKTAHDKKLFKYYFTSQLIELNITNGKMKNFAPPAIYYDVSSSPSGKYLLVEKIKKPYSYSVPYYRFSKTIEVWDRAGKFVHKIADLPVADEIPPYGVAKGIRNISWRSLKPATLVWCEALDDGDPEKQVPFRDKVLSLTAPFQGDAKEIFKVQHRYRGISWLQKGKALLSEYNWKKRWTKTFLVDVDKPGIKPKTLVDRSIHDRYNDPGRPVHTTTPKGERIVIQEGNWIYLSGSGASPDGDFPFMDKINIKTNKKIRLFHSAKDCYETFFGFMGNSRKKFITRYESKTSPPNYYLGDVNTKKKKALTHYKDPAPQLTGIKKQLIKYTRKDGVPLSGILYLPKNYKEGIRYPLVIWGYPLEYSNKKMAGQVRGSQNRFTFFRGTSQLFFLTQGYVVLDRAEMPVVGDPKTMNDTFVQQIVASADAAIKKLGSMGIIDPKRVGVGGHSYGAFMTANLLAHSNLFAAGVARSGAFNRTLTPFGFQSERRTLWQAPEIYFKVSPFMHAHKIKTPILLIHGEIDNNSGTFPIQSRRLFHALKGHGATARLVMLPNESHGYRAKESVLHVLAEMFEWFDKYVKNRK